MTSPLIIPVLHNVSSVQRVVDMARLVYGLGLDTLVITKAYGGAAQSGVPEAMRLALKSNAKLIVLPELKDALDLLSPDTFIAVTRSYAEERINPVNPPVTGSKVLIVFSGGDPEFTPQEIAGAKRVYIDGVEAKLGPIAEAALILYHLAKQEGREVEA